MTAQKGSMVLIKAGNGGAPELFTTIGGLRTTRMQLNNQVLQASHVESGAWRLLLAGGVKHISLGGSGIFTDAASEETVRANAFAGSINNYQLWFGNGDNISGAFIISAYERGGQHDDAETFGLTLESAGPITFTAA